MWQRSRAWPMKISIALFVALTTVGCIGGTQDLTAPGLSLPLPDGWSHRQDQTSLVTASRSGDLEATTPEGPRIWIHWAGIDEDSQTELVEDLLFTGMEEETPAQVVAPPVRSQVDDVPVTTMELQMGEVQQRYVIANPGADHVYTFILEAPAERWETALPELERILETATFTEKF